MKTSNANLATIYCITNTTNNKKYIGYTEGDVAKRLQRHYHESRSRPDKNMPILAAIRKHGIDNFVVDVLFQHTDKEFVYNHMENYYIHKYNTRDKKHGYNAKDGGVGSPGLKHKQESIELMREKATNRRHSEKTREKMSASHKGKTFTNSHRQKMSAAASKRTHTKETKQKLSRINESHIYEITDPSGNVYTTTNLNALAKKHNLSNVYRVVSGEYKQTKGFKIKKLDSLYLRIKEGVSISSIRKHSINKEYTIYEDEYEQKPDVVRSFISKTTERRIYARNTVCRVIPNKIATEFINANHIQDTRLSKICYGLYLGEELVMVMSFASHHRNPENDTIILKRMCSKIYTQVVGGASKLLHHSIRDHPEWKQVISWSDNRLSKGDVYAKLGFSLDGELGPDYTYYCPTTNKRYNKQRFMKSKIGCAPGQTERERMQELGYKRVYDLGKNRWKYTTL